MRDINVSTTNGVDNIDTKVVTVSFICVVLNMCSILGIINKDWK
jgi:hypothetical protein